MSEIKVNEVMNSQPTVTDKDMQIDALRRLMNQCGERYLPWLKEIKFWAWFHFMTLQGYVKSL